MSERQFAVSGDWALGADSLQWILYRRRSRVKGGWSAVSFVASTRDVLERCMREKGCSSEDRARLLDGLPSTFDQWRGGLQASSQPVLDPLEPRTSGGGAPCPEAPSQPVLDPPEPGALEGRRDLDGSGAAS
jgi:hypothetical protein